MKFSIIPSFSVFIFPTITYAVSLIEALNANGASQFAQQIQANPDILALYNSPAVKTVYAIPDSSIGNSTLRLRAVADPQRLSLHASGQLTNLETLSVFPGSVSKSNLNSPQLQQPQAVVSQSGVSTNTSSSSRRRSVGGTIPSTPVSIASGLGNKVNLVSGDIAYDGGLIHVVDGFFTVPVSLSDTISSTGLSTLQGLLNQSNLSSTFNQANSFTLFTPSNAAFAAAVNTTNTTSPAALQNLLQNHAIPNFVGYLPDLVDGATYTTLSGNTLTVTVKNKAYFINGVRIVSPNTITQNGVAHVINGILTPTPPVFTGAGWMLRPGYGVVAAVVTALLVQLV
ncbi:FAS1 domain-containing protein [Lepidopterella palustris CBS 459.81]|uniref:FAS1 domain-containing protein n=1 Tax=Lepidopterella palustris CBS 459.81 TaxID=1314670 RepID=A0A8E2DY09_9PEZI|nr:FAS1 domain-containing protein [Lepidopterella palustris CBS 459.81]